MIQCQNCGQANVPESQFCRFCGTKFLIAQPMPQQNHGYQAPPRPYAWKTDEYQTHADPRRSPAGAQPASQPLTHRDPHFMSGNYRCPNCMSQFLPRIERRISTTGWVVFGIFIATVALVPLCWVGLLIKEDTQVCPSCGARLR